MGLKIAIPAKTANNSQNLFANNAKNYLHKSLISL